MSTSSRLAPNEAQLWANYADVYAMAHGQTLQNDEVTKLLAKALEIDPNNPTALGTVRFSSHGA